MANDDDSHDEYIDSLSPERARAELERMKRRRPGNWYPRQLEAEACADPPWKLKVLGRAIAAADAIERARDLLTQLVDEFLPRDDDARFCGPDSALRLARKIHGQVSAVEEAWTLVALLKDFPETADYPDEAESPAAETSGAADSCAEMDGSAGEKTP